MFKAQITDGEQIECEEYETGESGVELFDENDEFIAFVPYAHLIYVGSVTEGGQMVW
jgi:hypothetical protein